MIRVIGLNKKLILNKCVIICYIIIIHILFLNYFRETFLTSYDGLLYIYDFNFGKYCFCLFESACLYFHTTKIIKTERMTETIVVFLNLMYFIPGFVQQATTNAEWEYMVFYFAFWLGIVIWMKILKPHEYSLLGSLFKTKRAYQYLLGLTAIAIIISVFMSIYTRRYLTLSNLVGTLTDVYGVRAESTEQSIHWILINFEYWAAYFMVAALGYFSEKRKWIIVSVLLIGELSLFVLQGNRIILFLAIVAVMSGLFKITNTRLVYGLLFIMLFCLLEVNIKRTGFLVTDTFRRFTIVPNRLGEQYFDYFKSHIPDYLRSSSDRIVKLLGIQSPYYSPNIGRIIGQEYYGRVMGANTGLVGGAAFSFGILGPVLTTFGYVYAFRMFEGATAGLRNSRMTMAIALFLGSLVINTPNLLKGIFSLSYIMMLYLSMIPLSRSFSYDIDIGE